MRILKFFGSSFMALMDLRMQQALLRTKAVKEGFELGPVAKEVASRSGNNLAKRPLAQFAVDALLAPTKQDPLSFATSDTILTAAQKLNSNAIFLGDDDSEGWAIYAGRAGKTSLEAFRGSLSQRSDEDVTVDGAWIKGKPKDPIFVANSRIPRGPLESLIQESYEKAYVSIDQISDFWFGLGIPGSAFGSIPQIDLLIENQAAYPLFARNSTARLYGSLSSAQRLAASNKGGLTLGLGGLTLVQRQLLDEFTYNDDKEVRNAKGQSYYGVSGPFVERTELLPDGLPADATLNVSVTTRTAFYTHATMSDNYEFVYPADLDAVASYIARYQHPDLFKDSEGVEVDSFQLGQQRTAKLAVRATGIEISDSITENQPATGPPVSIGKLLDSLPEDLRKKVQDKLDALLQRVQRRQSTEPAAAPNPNPNPVQPPDH